MGEDGTFQAEQDAAMARQIAQITDREVAAFRQLTRPPDHVPDPRARARGARRRKAKVANASRAKNRRK